MSTVTQTNQGRSREASEIVRLRRAAAVGRLMLGELDAPLEEIGQEHYVGKPRRELKAEVAAVRFSLRNELRKFCQKNFVDVNPEKLGDLYEDILAHNSQFRLPLHEFVKRVGQPRSNVLKGAPAHATIHLSPWGLQTEYPEMHLARDLALSYNDALDAEALRGVVRFRTCTVTILSSIAMRIAWTLWDWIANTTTIQYGQSVWSSTWCHRPMPADRDGEAAGP